MNKTISFTKKFGFGVCLFLVLFMLCLSIFFYLSYWKDSQLLEMLALKLTENTDTLDKKVQVLNSFVYHNQGFAKNTDYYLLKSLGPTPIQILKKGGDCTDKSRLLAAMLEQIGIEASLAMMYPCKECLPVHTVVLAKTESGIISADPVYDLMFPKETGGYYDVRELMNDPEIQTNRLHALRILRGPRDKIMGYHEPSHHFQFITTVNWSKYIWLRWIESALNGLNLTAHLMTRPALLEDPKLGLSALSGIGAVLFAILAVVFRLSNIIGNKSRASLKLE